MKKIGDEQIWLQLDGYESYLNALEKIDEDGQINEVVSPGDCTDLCSTIDQEIGSFVKAEFNKAFMIHFKADPDRWAEGRDIILRAFRGTGVGIDVEGKERKNIRFPGFETYVPPEKDEEHNDDPITEAEVNELTKAEREFQKKKKKRKQNAKEAALRKRVKKRAQEMK